MTKQPPLVLFDGVCNFCNRSVNILIRHDKKNCFRFAALQSPAGQALLKKHGLDPNSFTSFVLIEGEKIYTKSTAVLQLTKHLPWYWKGLQLLRLMPRSVRDAFYDWIARNRYRWFGRKNACMMPTMEQRKKFV
ncbi:MAG TPA: thiol-disulfide oxidoreductase DCC family protein [Flavisolibacter sp.]|nr:thiol-disulfide oxidoreductase DCC family protein [Flavisolibacter sp.]